MNPTNKMAAAYWPEPVRVLSHTISAYGFVAIESVGLETGRHYSTTLPADQWDSLRAPAEAVPTFNADPVSFRLAVEARRLRLAYSCDPLLAINNSDVDVLPHQVEAVYGVMLPQATIRHLMAHDAGAGKTIMAGLLYKELRMRQPGLRTLIVAPAGLTRQWQRELRDKFFEDFTIVDRQELIADPGIWSRSNHLITSIGFARQLDVQAMLASVQWDLVIVDEAHHMAGYAKSKTLAYRLGQILSRQTRHLVLATATPHKGDPQNFLRLLQLLDPGIHDSSIVRQGADGGRSSPLMLRRLKEEMVTFDGRPIFKPRIVETRWHAVGDNPPEMELYTALTEYVDKTYRAAEKIGGREKVNVQFAMTLLQRRMNSSFSALESSLHRRRAALLSNDTSPSPVYPADETEDLPEQDRWDVEQAAELATGARSKRAREKEAREIQGLLDMIAAVRGSGVETKVTALQKILEDAGIEPGNGEKLLVFTEFKDTLDFLRRLLEEWGFTVTQIDGSMPHDERVLAEEAFRRRVQAMVATEAAGEGINLQFCAHMVNYDLPWVPTRLEQRMGRIHRYGQERVARIYNLSAGDTREGSVLIGLMERLEEMRHDLGDQVFDVVSTLVSDVDVEALLTRVALAPPTQASQEEALQTLIAATQAGADRYKQWAEPPLPIDPEQFAEMRMASRQYRLTPEYAQHFFVDALVQLREQPAPLGGADVPAGDADAIGISVTRSIVAQALNARVGRSLRFSFQREAHSRDDGIRYLALGTQPFEGILRLVEDRCGHTLSDGAFFLDPDLAPGDAYLLWFLVALVLDGRGLPVDEALLAVRQTPETIRPAAAFSLIGVMPGSDPLVVPQSLLGLARDPKPVLTWSTRAQQLPYLSRVRARRSAITLLRRDPMLADARAALHAAEQVYGEQVFGAEGDVNGAEAAVAAAKHRLQVLELMFQREAACSLGAPELVGVAAVVAADVEPMENLPDLRPEVAAAAEAYAREYEEQHGRTVTDVTGEHKQYPYDFLSKGPGGIRCIEVKGTTTGKIILDENERHAAKHFGASYYLYIVHDPLGIPRISIVRDPLAKMTHDATLYSGVRYVYNPATWQAAAGEETT